MNARGITAALVAAGALGAGLLTAPQAEAVRYVAPASSSPKVISKSTSVSTIQVAPCNRSKDSCSITAVLSPGETGPAGSHWAYVQPGYRALKVGTKTVIQGGRWFNAGSVLTSTWKVQRA